MTVSGCTLSGNWAEGVSEWGSVGEGGAIYNAGTATTVTSKHGHTTTTTTTTYLTISNSTFSGNYVEGVGYDGTIVGPWTNGGGNTFN